MRSRLTLLVLIVVGVLFAAAAPARAQQRGADASRLVDPEEQSSLPARGSTFQSSPPGYYDGATGAQLDVAEKLALRNMRIAKQRGPLPGEMRHYRRELKAIRRARGRNDSTFGVSEGQAALNIAKTWQKTWEDKARSDAQQEKLQAEIDAAKARVAEHFGVEQVTDEQVLEFIEEMQERAAENEGAAFAPRPREDLASYVERLAEYRETAERIDTETQMPSVYLPRRIKVDRVPDPSELPEGAWLEMDGVEVTVVLPAERELPEHGWFEMRGTVVKPVIPEQARFEGEERQDLGNVDAAYERNDTDLGDPQGPLPQTQPATDTPRPSPPAREDRPTPRSRQETAPPREKKSLRRRLGEVKGRMKRAAADQWRKWFPRKRKQPRPPREPGPGDPGYRIPYGPYEGATVICGKTDHRGVCVGMDRNE